MFTTVNYYVCSLSDTYPRLGHSSSRVVQSQTAIVWYNTCITADNQSHAPYPHSWTILRDTWTPSLGPATHSQPGGSNLLFFGREPQPQISHLTPSHTSDSEGHCLMKPTERHHLQRASSLRVCLEIISMEITSSIETKDNPDGGQHPLDTHLSLQLYKDWMGHSINPCTPLSCSPLHPPRSLSFPRRAPRPPCDIEEVCPPRRLNNVQSLQHLRKNI